MGRDGTKLMTSRHESAEDRSAIALRLFVALCAQYPDKYIALIQPRDNTNRAQILLQLTGGIGSQARQKSLTRRARFVAARTSLKSSRYVRVIERTNSR